MSMRAPIVAAAIMAMAGTALATNDFSEQQTQQWAFPLSPGNTVLNFNQFDDQGGTRVLKQVCLEFEATIGATATAENDSTIAAPGFQLNLTGFVNVVGPDLSGFAGVNEVRSQPLDPSDGVEGSGPDYHNFGFVNDTVNGMDDTLVIAPYIGGGLVAINVDGTAGFSFSGTTDASLGILDLGASGFVTLIYKYSVIPTPGAVALFGVAGLGAIRRRR